MRMPALALGLFLAMPAAGAEPDTPKRIREQCRDRLKGLPGVASVGLAGVKDSYSLLIVCRNPETKEEARRLLGGDRFQGLRIFWTVAPPPSAAPKVPKLLQDKAPPKPEFDPDSGRPPWEARVTDCDIVRDYLKLKPVTRRAPNGRVWKPCRIHHRQVVGVGGGHSYRYTKHRGDCPIRLGRVVEPTWADHTIAWIFRKGFTPAVRGGFLWPTELRADDKLWARQATQDLRSRLPHIRAGAEWGYTDSGWVKTPYGSLPTGGWPGERWSWFSPRSMPYGGTYRPGCCGGCVR